MPTTLYNLIDQALDIAGSYTHDAAMDWDEEDSYLGRPLSGQSGSTASIITGAGAGEARVDGVSGMTAADEGKFLTISGAASGANNGTFIISNVVDADTVDVVNASAVIPDGNNGSIAWVERYPYSAEDDFNYIRTDRQAIKGVDYHAAVPTYERPDAVGTDVDANLANLAGKTADALATVRNVYTEDVALPPSIADGDGNVLISDETFTTTNFHFTSDDVDSFVTLTDGTAVGATGTYRVKTVTDGQTLELDGLAATGAGTVTWVREGDLKGISTSRDYADAVDRTGVPIADSGAEDETVYDATFIEVLEELSTGGKATVESEAALRIFGRSFGDEKDPNRTVTNEGSRLFMQLKTGDNDGSATDSSVEPISGRSGSAASLPGSNTNVTGLTGMSEADIGLYITIWNLAADEAGHYKITAVPSASSVTVERGSNFTADASGAIEWQISRHSGVLFTFHGDRFRNDNLSETWGRAVLVGGSGGTSELVVDIDQIRDSIGIQDGDTDLSAYLTNTGNYFTFVDLPDATPSVVEALNVLNEQIGNRTYTSSLLTDGQTITASIEAIANAIDDVSVVRYIEVASTDINVGTSHTLPGSASYTLDGTGNGRNMWFFSRGILRHPGTDPSYYEYEEESTTTILVKRKIKADDVMDFFILK